MNCSKHQDVAAVSQCGECGAGMCSECVSASEYRVDNKPMCRDCNFSYINYQIEENTKTNKWRLIKLILNGFCIIVGIGVWLGGGDVMAALCVFALGGIPTAWKLFSSSDKEKAENKFDDAVADIKYGEGSGLLNSVIRFIIRVIFTVVAGAIAAPILLIVNIVKYMRCDKETKEYEAALANFDN
jgi:hypothetical protein